MDAKPNVMLMAILKLEGITQGQLVRAAGIASETRFSRIINGIQIPREDEVEQICRVLGRAPREIFTDWSPTKPKDEKK